MSKTEKKPTDKNKKHITIKKINIIVETNIEGEKPFSITYDKIYNPVKNKIVFSQKKLDYPFITFDIKYDENVLYELNRKDYGELLRAFFDMTYFTSMVKKMREKNGIVAEKPIEKEKNQIINHNIFMMLYFLFPIKYPIPNNITSSYNSKICNSPGEFSVTLNRANVQTSFFSTFFNRFKNIEQERIREYSYVNTSKGESTITQIIWLNDFLNEPRYRELVDTLIQYEEWLSNLKETINDDIQNAQKDLFENAANDDEKDDDDYFKNNELEMIRKEIKFEYSFEKFKEDVINKFKETFVINKTFEVEDEKVDKDFLTFVQDKVIERIYGKDGINGINGKKITGLGAVEFKYFKVLVDNFQIDYNTIKRGEIELINFIDNINVIKTKINKVTLKENLIKMVESILDDLYKIINQDIRLEDISYELTPAKTTPQMRPSSISSPLGDYGEVYEISSTKFLKTINTDYCYQLFSASCGNKTYSAPKIINLEGLDCSEYNKQKIRADFGVFDFIYIYKDDIDKTPNNDFFSNAETQIKEKIKPFVQKYNDYVKITLGRDSRYGSYIRERETNIKKILEEMNNINENLTIKLNREDNFKNVMNSIDSLKRLFSDEFISKYQLTGVSSIQIKVEKLLKMTNEIKALQLTKIFFEKSKGINLYYDKEQTKSNMDLMNELRKEKYFYFTNTVKFIKEKFINSNRESTNTQINKMMNTYFNNTSNDFITKVVIPAKNAINENEDIGCADYFNTLVTKTRPSNDQKDPEYEINLYVEVIVGKIDYQNQQNITCNYRDQNLIQMYNELTSSPNKFEVLKKNNTIFLSNIIDNVKKDVTNIATENKIPALPPAIPVTGGIRKRRTYRGRGKKIHKYTRKIH
jgi:hypothetical protein